MTEATTTQSLDEINAAIADLQAKAAEMRKQARAAAIERCNFFVQEFDLAAFELKLSEAKAKKPRKAKEAKAPTHRGPNGELWAGGLGRKPEWVRNVLASGGTLDAYAI